MGYLIRRIDKNQTQVVEYLRKCGAKVYITSSIGSGFPDLVILWENKITLIELKDGSRPPSGQKLTEKEQKFYDDWYPHVRIINSIDQAKEFLRL